MQPTLVPHAVDGRRCAEERETHAMAFDGEICVKLLLDKGTDPADRLAAAESLMHYPKSQACDALFSVAMDDSEEEWLREEAAGSLGGLWCEMGIDYARIGKLPKHYLIESVQDFPHRHVKIDLDRIEEGREGFLERIKGEAFLESLVQSQRRETHNKSMESNG